MRIKRMSTVGHRCGPRPGADTPRYRRVDYLSRKSDRILVAQVVELLVRHGCSLDSVDAENRTALRAASWSGHEEIVRILLQHRANVNLTDHEGILSVLSFC